MFVGGLRMVACFFRFLKALGVFAPAMLFCCGEAALRRRYSSRIAKLDDVTVVLLGIEIIVLILVKQAALDDAIPARGEAGDGLLAVLVLEFDVVQPLAAALEMLVVDAVAGQRLHEFDLRAATPVTAIRQECVAGLPR